MSFTDLGDYTALEPWLGSCDHCTRLHCVDESYIGPKSQCLVQSHGYACGGRIMYITCRSDVVAAYKLGGAEAVAVMLDRNGLQIAHVDSSD